MMKRLGIICAALFLIVSLQAAGYGAEKIGYVDINKLLEGYSKTEEYDKALEKEQDKYEKERQKQVDKIKAQQDKMSLLSEKEQADKKGNLEEDIKKLREFDREWQTDLRKERDEKLSDILRDIEKAITEYAKKEKFSLIFNDKVIAYRDKDLDVTEAVFKILQKK